MTEDSKDPDADSTGLSAGPGNGSSDHHWKQGDPERRHTSAKARREYARDHGLPASADDSGRPWKSYVPHSVLWALLSMVLMVGGWFAKQWTDDRLRWMARVDEHVREATAGQRRLDSLEHEVRSLGVEFRDYRIDQVEERIWTAQRAGDEVAVRYFRNQLRRLKAEPNN